MRSNRLVFFILWILSLVCISFFGGPVSYGIFFLLTLVPVVSAAYVLYVYFFYRIYQELGNKSPVAGHVVPFYFTLMKEFHVGFCSIRVSFFSSFSTISGLEGDPEYELLPKTGIKKQTNLLCRYRGEYEVGIKTVEIQDPFRLIRLKCHNKETLRVVVRPDLKELRETGRIDEAQTMSRDSLSDPDEPDVTVRKYVPGDDIRQINWKSSARTGELLVRKMTGEEREGISILMGTERKSDDPFIYLPSENKMLELTLALTLFFVKKNIPARILWQEGTVVEQRVTALEGFDPFYERMSSVEFKKDSSEAALLGAAAGVSGLFQSKTVFLVLNELSAEAAEFVRILRMNNVSAEICVINDDKAAAETTEDIPGIRVVRIGTTQDLSEAGL